jgi:F420-0:gamma-glutamyl ligase
MQIKPITTNIFHQGDNLADFVVDSVGRVKDKSILVVTSKIVSLAQNRVIEIKNEKDRIRAIKKESQYAMRTKYTWLTIRDNMVMSSAGVDESNANGKLILLPKDSFQTARNLRKFLMKEFKLKNLGVLITDSRLLPLRAGIVGVALGYSGFKGLVRHKGKMDIFGRKIKTARTDVADSLAAIAVLAMGEGNERRPLAIIENTNVEFVNRINKKELSIDVSDDMYQPLFAKIKRIKIKNGPCFYDV